MENDRSAAFKSSPEGCNRQEPTGQSTILPREEQSFSTSTCDLTTKISQAPSRSGGPSRSVITATEVYNWYHDRYALTQQQLSTGEQQDFMHLGSWAAIDGAYNTSQQGDVPTSDMLRSPPAFVDPSTAISSSKEDPTLANGLREMSQNKHEDQAIALLRASLHHGC